MALISCSECKKEISDQALSCPGCGFPLEVKEIQKERIFTEAEELKLESVSKVKGFFSGLFLSVLIIPAGLFLSMTGIGALIGIPLIIFGLFAPFLGLTGKKYVKGEMIGTGILKGPCPYCKKEFTTAKMDSSVDCPHCKKRLFVEGEKYYQI